MTGATDDPDPPPLLVAIVGPGGEARSAFFRDFVRSNRLPFVNPGLIADAHKLGAREAVEAAKQLCDDLIARAQSFVLVTEISDPEGGSVELLRRLSVSGYRVEVFFIGLNCSEEPDGEAGLRSTGGGHGVPADELLAYYPQTLGNLLRALRTLPGVLIYDNMDPAQQICFVAEYRAGVPERIGEQVPAWFDAFIERLHSP